DGFTDEQPERRSTNCALSSVHVSCRCYLFSLFSLPGDAAEHLFQVKLGSGLPPPLLPRPSRRANRMPALGRGASGLVTNRRIGRCPSFVGSHGSRPANP